jgi:hypothetical protein
MVVKVVLKAKARATTKILNGAMLADRGVGLVRAEIAFVHLAVRELSTNGVCPVLIRNAPNAGLQ